MAGTSLRQQLLIWLLPAALVILLASILIAYLIASRAAGEAYDRGLHDAAEAYAERVRQQNSHLPRELPASAERMLVAAPDDQIWFRLRTRDGQTLAGDAALPDLPPRHGDEIRRYGNASFLGRDIRVIAMNFDSRHGELELSIASTMGMRDALVRDIVLGMIIPEMILFFAMIVLMEVAIERGLLPLDKLRNEISARSHLDLRPVTLDQVPDELHAVAREVNELLERLARSISAQNSFVADAAHQLRTPVAALQAQTEILLGETGESPQRERVQRLAMASARLSQLVRQLLALARAEPSLLQVERVDLAEIVGAAADPLFRQALAAGIDLGFDLHPAPTQGSPVLLREMLGNLVDNALRYTPSPGTVNIHCTRQGKEVLLRVEDSGPGIPEAERTAIFERFHRLPDSPPEGTGLGLAIVREIARTHGGSVSVSQGEALHGALFEVRLPAT